MNRLLNDLICLVDRLLVLEPSLSANSMDFDCCKEEESTVSV